MRPAVLRRAVKPILSTEERNAILTGLRLLQQRLDMGGSPPLDLVDVFTNCGTEKPLTVEEIDRLCERINRA